MVSASQLVEKLNLLPHPEGGFYSETFRDTSVTLSKSQLPPQYAVTHFLGTTIHVLEGPVGHKKLLQMIVIWCDGLQSLALDKVDRPISTCIYFLLPSGSVSHLHRLPMAETWHFYMGEPLTVLEMNESDGSIKLTCLGSNPMEDNQHLQYTVPPYVWFGSFPTLDFDISMENGAVKTTTRDSESHFSLVGCTCAPAFQFEDFELAKRSELVSHFPKYEALIKLLTYDE